MCFFVFVFACRLTDMGAKDVHHGLTQASRVFRQMEELVSAAHAHGVPLMP